MYKYVCLTLALTSLLELSSSYPRHPRSIWPWSSSEASTLISEKHADLLRQSGYSEYLDLSKHPLWKIHKYEGIDLKPVRLQTEIVQSKELQPEVEQRNPVSSEVVVPLTESDDDEQTPLPDLSFLNDLGGLAYFLPEPEEDEEETEKASLLADAIANEEQSYPGFLWKLWSMIWGYDLSRNDEHEDSTSALHVSLPATKENYAEISLVKPSTDQLAKSVQTTTLNQTDQYALNAGEEQVKKPVTKWYEPSEQFSRSQAWIQSWNPNAAYNVHVEGPSEYPMEHVDKIHSYTSNPNNQFQKKVSKDEDEETMSLAEEKIKSSVNENNNNNNNNNTHETNVPVSEEIVTEKTSTDLHMVNPKRNISEEKNVQVTEGETEGQVQQVAERLESNITETKRSDSLRQKVVSALKMNIVPHKILRQLQISEQEIDDFVNNRESSNKTWNKIRIHLHQLGPRFPAMRRMFFE